MVSPASLWRSPGLTRESVTQPPDAAVVGAEVVRLSSDQLRLVGGVVRACGRGGGGHARAALRHGHLVEAVVVVEYGRVGDACHGGQSALIELDDLPVIRGHG